MIPPKLAPGTLERRPFSSKQAAPSALPDYHHALCLLRPQKPGVPHSLICRKLGWMSGLACSQQAEYRKRDHWPPPRRHNPVGDQPHLDWQQ